MSEFYNQNGIKVRYSTRQDAEYLAKNMRQTDIREIWDSHHHTPETAMKIAVLDSLIAFTVERDDVPVIMFGIYPESICGVKASIWMLATDDMKKISLRVVRHSRRFVNMMLEYYPHLENYVSNDNKRSITWLRALGAKLYDPAPYGIEQKLFRKFTFERAKVCATR